jgi:diaminohydroxyphosphoribosylaminopyrimidine deaminase/5-amino-6-(5-phosphoribosylamino)uracil reductase
VEKKFMDRALELAYLGLGKVSPNPMVGCVIVKDGKIIGEGWHQKFGGPHAEVNAIKSIKDKDKVRGSDVYVTLEPCSHHGKTPPCSDLLISLGVKNVYISNPDINPLVSGKGMQKMKKASIKVAAGINEEEGSNLNKRFFTYHSKKRPYIILKWAQTIDRFIARKNFDSKWISNEYSRQLVHKWRAEEDSIMVGANTAIYDNPKLNVRDWPDNGQAPTRIVVDPNLKVPEDSLVFDGAQPTLIYNYNKSADEVNIKWIKLHKGRFIEEVITDLYNKEIQSVLVEGGSYLINSFISKNIWDEARVFISENTFGEGIKAPDLYHASLVGKNKIFNDEILLFKNTYG